MGDELTRLRAQVELLKQQNARLWETLRLAQDGLLLGVIEVDTFDWPDAAPNYHEDGRAHASSDPSGEWWTTRTAAGDRSVQEAIDVVASTLAHGPEFADVDRRPAASPEGGEANG